MALIDEVRDSITANYNMEIESLMSHADIVASHERAALFSGLLATISVYGDSVYAFLSVRMREEKAAMDYVKQYNGTYFGMIAGKPAFLCDVNGDSVFILGE